MGPWKWSQTPVRCSVNTNGRTGPRRSNGPGPRLQVEPLEPRWVLDSRLVISELVASNVHGLEDEDGEHPDWLEIYNAGDRSADLSGWFLTDDPDDLDQWEFPDGIHLAPGEHLVVFASGKDHVGPSGQLHTNFRLSAVGEYLALVQREGSSVAFAYAPQYPPQRPDTSYGFPSAATTFQLDESGFFNTPTPEATNLRDVDFQGTVDVTVSVPRGFYQQPVDVVLASQTPGATIVYTTNGGTPSEKNGTRVAPPDANTEPTASVHLSATTTLRVAAFKDNFLPSTVSTHTYIFVDDVIEQSADGFTPDGWPTGPINGQILDFGMDPDVIDDLRFAPHVIDALLDIPSISIVTDPDHLFDPDTGIYVNGVASRRNARAWERPASVELIHPNGDEGFQINAGLRLRGGISRSGSNPKHSFRLLFRGQYGSDKLRYPLFGDEGASEFDNLDLRTAQAMSWNWCVPDVSAVQGGCQHNTMLRDVFARDTQRDMGMPYTRSRYYHVYLNGQYWGLYQSEERPEASYAESYFDGDKEDFDVIKVEGFPHHVEATDGNLDAWRQLWEAAKAGFESDEAYYRVQGLNPDGTRNANYPVLLDVDHLIDYMLVVLYTGDLDGPISNFGYKGVVNNWFGIRNRNGEEGFRFFIHDAEWTLLNVHESRIGPWRTGNTFDQSNPQWLHQQLMANDDYLTRFGDRAQKYLFNGGALTPEAALTRLQSRVDQIDLAIIAESARWGDANRGRPYTKNDWLNEVKQITESFIPQRTEILTRQFNRALRTRHPEIRAPLYPDIAAPVFSHMGGQVPPGLELTFDSTHDVYYTVDGTDPRQSAAVIEFETLLEERTLAQIHVPQDDSLLRSWTELDFDDSGWERGYTGVGYERDTGFESLIGFDTEERMDGENTSVYIRLLFDVADPDRFDVLQLNMKYDDGFVAYLNGTEVARRHAPEDLSSNSRATGTHFDPVAVEFEHIDISDSLGELHQGANVLAIHGLNLGNQRDDDYLVLPQLTAGTTTDRGISPSAVTYTRPIPLSGNTVVRARALVGNKWSALVEAAFVTQPSPLRITEIMYHPADPSPRERNAGFRDDDDFEFIELTNTSEVETVNLRDVAFTQGVDFVFPDLALAAGESVLVVANQDAFHERYGAGARIAGEYGTTAGSSKLSNSGEALRLEDAAGIAIQEIAFDDAWYPETDGTGYSLEFVDAKDANPLSWNDRSSWRPSVAVGGSAGSTVHTAKLQLGDVNSDGVFNQLDLVQLLTAGTYRSGRPVDWTDGDWNQDGIFDQFDLVMALQAAKRPL